MEMGCQLHDLDANPHDNSPWYLGTESWVGPRVGLNVIEKSLSLYRVTLTSHLRVICSFNLPLQNECGEDAATLYKQVTNKVALRSMWGEEDMEPGAQNFILFL
jgi:hypothetical protein